MGIKGCEQPSPPASGKAGLSRWLMELLDFTVRLDMGNE